METVILYLIRDYNLRLGGYTFNLILVINAEINRKVNHSEISGPHGDEYMTVIFTIIKMYK
jgi:hypothetical protein